MRGENFGRSTQFLSDLDGDGVPDMAIGDDECTWVLSSRSRAILARLPALCGIVDVGDVDHDGTHDLSFIERVAADGLNRTLPPRDASAPSRSGTSYNGTSYKWSKHARVCIVSGRSFVTLHEFDVEDGSWSPMCSGGDFDHDGVQDLVFLLTDPARSGFWPRGVDVRSGATGKRIALLPVRADVPVQPRTECFDWGLHVVADVDGDDIPDVFVVSRPVAFFDRSSVRCMSGASGATIWERELGRDELSVGERVLDAGDWDGDGHPDVIFNAPAFGPDWNHKRPVRVLSTPDGREIDRFVSSESQAVATERAFAVDFALVRGARADGRVELWCSSVWAKDGLAGTGLLEVVGPDHGVESVTLPDDVPFGTALASGADVTGDGVDDVLVSGFEWFGGIAGSVLLIDGKSRQVIERFTPDDLDRELGTRAR